MPVDQRTPPRETDTRPLFLVVEDDNLVRTMLAEAIESLPVRVVPLAHAEEALAFAAKRRIDLVIADHYLDGMTGLSLLIQFQGLPRPPRSVLVSAHVDKHMAMQAVNRASVSRLLEKPLDRHAVRVLVCELLGLPVTLAD